MKLFEKQVFIALSSKEQNIKAGSHCNFMIFQWKPDLTFEKWSKNYICGHLKQVSVAKNVKKYPQNDPNHLILSMEMDLEGLLLQYAHFALLLCHNIKQKWAEMYQKIQSPIYPFH